MALLPTAPSPWQSVKPAWPCGPGRQSPYRTELFHLVQDGHRLPGQSHPMFPVGLHALGREVHSGACGRARSTARRLPRLTGKPSGTEILGTARSARHLSELAINAQISRQEAA